MAEDLYVETIGSEGTPLLMLHGWGQTHLSLKPLGNLLFSHSSVHLIDLPGFGRSSTPETTWSAFDYADRIIAYLDEQKISQADTLGHSFGGKVAMCLAIRYPNRVRNLMLLAASGLQRKRSFLEMCRLKSVQWLGKATKLTDSLFGTALFKCSFTPRFGSADYQKAGEMRSILVRSIQEDLSAEIGTIETPTLILWGEKDRETPKEMGERIHSFITHSTLHIFPHKDHDLFKDSGAHLLALYILRYLEARK